MRDIDRRPPPMPTRPGPAFRVLALLASGLFVPSTRADDTDLPPILRLANGGIVAGALVESEGPELLRWHGSAFDSPFDFRLDAVESIRWPSPEPRPEPSGPDTVELTTDDLLFGTLIGLDDAGATLDTPEFGPVNIAREYLRRIDRRQGDSAPAYFGPNGLTEWEVVSKPDSWTEEAGQIATETGGASLWLDAGLPARAAIEVELSWQEKPSFVLAFGVGPDEESRRHGFQFEVWGPDLVALREADQKAEIAWLSKLENGPGRIRVRAFLDQENGRFDIVPTAGIASASLALGGTDRPPLPGVFLSNIRGDVRLERLIIRRWDGSLPPEIPADTPCLVRDDGSLAIGSPTEFDSSENVFIIRDENGDETRVPADRAAMLSFSQDRDEEERPLVLARHDGIRLSGSLLEVDDDSIRLDVIGINDPLSVPVTSVQSLSVPGRDEPRPDDPPIPSAGTFERDDTRIRGHLVPGDDDSRLAWQPIGSASAGLLPPNTSGRIVYKETIPRLAGDSPNRVVAGNQGRFLGEVRFEGGVGQVFVDMAPGAGMIAGGMGDPPWAPNIVARGGMRMGDVSDPYAPAPAPNPIQGRMLQLRSGDVIPADVVSIDDDGVHFQSTHAEQTLIPHDRIRALSFAPVDPGVSPPTEAEFARLMTLPRMQRGNPPTHLIRSRNGDYLRGRLLGMSDQWLRVEVRLGERRLPRAILSEIRWLQPEEDESAEDEPGTPAPADQLDGLRVLAVRSDGIRMSFAAHRVDEEGTLIGASESLGNCHVPLGEVDRLAFGAAIDEETLIEDAIVWALRDAVDPQFVQADGADGNTPGTASALVGEPAPEIKLDLLDGEKFVLADHRGEIVVLDFWATWCGPCLQVMPQVEAVADEFRDRGVRLVAVNLEEGADQITATLERHRLSMPVALDRDGAIAARYGVTAIPQTVIIDQDGTVARLFVGGGPRLADQIRDALETLVPLEDSP